MFLQNLPIYLMYTCFIVVHRTLLNSYVLIQKKNMKERRKYVDYFYWSMFILYSAS